MSSLAFLFAFVTGAMMTCQVGANNQLKQAVKQPLFPLAVNYLLGIAAVLAYAAVRRLSLPSFQQAAGVPWWGWIGGLLGAISGLTAILLAHKLGAATLTALAITGQLACAILLDHFGWLSFELHPAGWGRIVGSAFMLAGLVLIAKY